MKDLEVKILIDEYQYVFTKLKHLPLIRKLDHKIPPIPRAKSVNIRSCMSSFEHKKEIEKLVKEIL